MKGVVGVTGDWNSRCRRTREQWRSREKVLGGASIFPVWRLPSSLFSSSVSTTKERRVVVVTPQDAISTFASLFIGCDDVGDDDDAVKDQQDN